MRRPIPAVVLTLALIAGACGGASPAPEPRTLDQPDATTPAARGYALMAPTNEGRVLMVGGFDCPSCDPSFSGFDDMWELDATGAWTALAPATLPPEGDDFAFDSRAGRAVYLEIDGTTWTYDPQADGWSELPVEGGPGALHGSRMVYDEGSDRMIVFSGDDFSAAGLHDETWAFDLEAGTWERMHPEVSPPPRTYYAMAYDAGSDRVILFGGTGPLADTWAYDHDHDAWEEMDPKRSPPARVYAAAAYDPASDRVVLYGGSADEERAAFQDTWAYDYDTDTWTSLASVSAIGDLAWHAMSSSEAGIVLFGGGVTRDDYVAGTWWFDPQNATWTAADAR